MKLLILLLALATSASAQEFPGFTGLQETLQNLKFQPGAVKQPADATRVSVPRGIVPPKGQYPVRGFDVSHYQGSIQWDKVKGQDLAFVYIKATEGDDLTDDQFSANWKGAQRAGLRRGAYHFYNFCQSGSAQADHLLKIVPAGADLPLAIDLEVSKSCKTLPSKAALRKSLANFVAKVQKGLGKTPAVYVNDLFYDKYFKGENDPYPVWITERLEVPQLSDRREWTFWQFSFKGSIAGIDGDVDLDVFNGGQDKLARLDVPQAVLLAQADPAN